MTVKTIYGPRWLNLKEVANIASIQLGKTVSVDDKGKDLMIIQEGVHNDIKLLEIIGIKVEIVL